MLVCSALGTLHLIACGQYEKAQSRDNVISSTDHVGLLHYAATLSLLACRNVHGLCDRRAPSDDQVDAPFIYGLDGMQPPNLHEGVQHTEVLLKVGGRGAIHNANWHMHLSPKHEEEGVWPVVGCTLVLYARHNSLS